MTIKELIEKLKEWPEDTLVFTHDVDYGYDEPDPYYSESHKNGSIIL